MTASSIHYVRQMSSVSAAKNTAVRRAAVLRKKIITMALTCIIIVLTMCLLSGFTRMPKETEKGQLYYRTVYVKSEDTLWSIASANLQTPYKSVSQYIRSIKKLNDLHSDRIYYGQKILIPYYSESSE